jgi:hypothetical protein
MGKKVFTNIVWMLTMGVSCALGTAVYYSLVHWEVQVALFCKCPMTAHELNHNVELRATHHEWDSNSQF